MTLGGGAYSLKLPISFISSSVDERHPPREHTSPALKEHFYYQSRRAHQKHNSQPYPTDNYDPITIRAFFNKILRLSSAMPSSRYCQTAELHTPSRSQRCQPKSTPLHPPESIAHFRFTTLPITQKWATHPYQ